MRSTVSILYYPCTGSRSLPGKNLVPQATESPRVNGLDVRSALSSDGFAIETSHLENWHGAFPTTWAMTIQARRKI
jgi:hypothetical protein